MKNVLICSLAVLIVIAAAFTLSSCMKDKNAKDDPASGSEVTADASKSNAADSAAAPTTEPEKEPTATPTPEPTPTPTPTPEPTPAPEPADPTEAPTPAPGAADDDGISVVVLDPGHGGYDSGACYAGLQEKDITLKVAKYCRDYLVTNYENIEVYMTREDDTIMDRDKKKDLEMRCDLGRQVGANCLVSIHFNATDAHQLKGTEIWASRRSNVHDQTFALGNCIMAEFEKLGLANRGVNMRKSNDMFDSEGKALDYYAINRHCANRDLPGIIVEQCFMDNDYDQQFIKTEEGLKNLGEANAKGIAAYLGLKRKTE